jgi:hypothetical protein
LDDYKIIAGLDGINPNYLGMIDQVVCTRATIFVGTWFSTFSGYITRMRGYLGLEDKSVFYADLPHRYFFFTFINASFLLLNYHVYLMIGIDFKSMNYQCLHII